ncbi:MAG TPA: large conductance mechanosensitive channel protein MscL [Isosphaeraceae bacterium]|jgi:large conductance mechanosensitive channel|nr:large conductance mechanosensitive channel protein MscL [Isosphaeraceae bacterium]
MALKGAELWKDFEKFALKGNIIDLGVAVVMGNAFGALVNSFVKNVIMPLIAYVLPKEGGYRAWKLGNVEVGAFLSELLNFFLISLAMYLVMVKLLGFLRHAARFPEKEPDTKVCPLCLSTIPVKARKCAHCTADLPAEAGT